MPNSDIIAACELNMKNENCCNCSQPDNTAPSCPTYWSPYPPPPPFPFPKPGFPYGCPPIPPCPPYPNPNPCDCSCGDGTEELPDAKVGSIEKQICRLSKKAATINRMIDNLNKKKRDVIIKVGDASYNFGNISIDVEKLSEKLATIESESKNYAEIVNDMLEAERALIQDEIKELAGKLETEAEAISLNLMKTVATDLSGE